MLKIDQQGYHFEKNPPHTFTGDQSLWKMRENAPTDAIAYMGITEMKKIYFRYSSTDYDN